MSLLYKSQTNQNISGIRVVFFWYLLRVKLTKNHSHEVWLLVLLRDPFKTSDEYYRHVYLWEYPQRLCYFVMMIKALNSVINRKILHIRLYPLQIKESVNSLNSPSLTNPCGLLCCSSRVETKSEQISAED